MPSSLGSRFPDTSDAIAADATECPAVGPDETSPLAEHDTAPQARTRGRKKRRLAAVLLLLALFGSIVWIAFGWPLPFRLRLALILIAGLSAILLIAIYTPLVKWL